MRPGKPPDALRAARRARNQSRARWYCRGGDKEACRGDDNEGALPMHHMRWQAALRRIAKSVHRNNGRLVH